MDLSKGKSDLLQALALMKDEGELSVSVSKLLESVHEDKGKTVTLLCEALALRKQEVEKKQKVVKLLEEIAKWWSLLVEDREKLLLTISNLELEKEEILKKQSDPGEIYGALLEAETKSRKKPRLATITDDEDFKDSPKKTASFSKIG